MTAIRIELGALPVASMFIVVASYILRLFNRSALQYPRPHVYICLFGVLETNIQVMMTSRKRDLGPLSRMSIGPSRLPDKAARDDDHELLRLIRKLKPSQYLRACHALRSG